MEEQILIFRTSVRNARDIKLIAALFTLCPEISKALRAINIYALELE